MPLFYQFVELCLYMQLMVYQEFSGRYRHLLPEYGYDVYMQYRKDVYLTHDALIDISI